jgi:2-dehydro-3-deoxyphosphogluconate aldolase/(4S)-4-hydroxy-2-oxoglutarate aldolase
MTSVALNSLEESLVTSPVIAVIRGASAELDRTLNWLVSMGVRAVEVTTNTPEWQQGVALAKSKGFAHVGVGTVLTKEHVQQACDAGATFTVAPGLNEQVAMACRTEGLIHIPGVLTPTEIQAALNMGISTLKLFPAGPLGIDYLRALCAPFNEVRFIPTGGVSVASASDWIAAGAFAVGLGGAISQSGADSNEQTSSQLRSLTGTVSAESKL